MGEGGSRGLVLRVLPSIFPQGSDAPAGCWWIQVKIRLFIWQWYMKPQKIRIKTRMPRVIWYAQTRFALMNYSMLSRHTYTDIPYKGTWYNPTISWSSWSWSISWPSSWSIRRGGSGPLHVSRGSSGNPLHEAWLEAGQQVRGYEPFLWPWPGWIPTDRGHEWVPARGSGQDGRDHSQWAEVSRIS